MARITVEPIIQHRIEHALRVDQAGINALHERLQHANRENDQFDAQWRRLTEVLQTVLWRLERGFGDVVERVMAAGDWTHDGIDLRNLPCEDVHLLIVLRGDERPFSLYWQVAESVFSDLHDDDIVLQFRLATRQEWQHAVSHARAEDLNAGLGIPLLTRA